jgi:hypothetical protein
MNKHIRLAIDSMKLEIKGLNINANMHEQYGADEPFCIKASKKRIALHAAIQYLVALDLSLKGE